MNIQFNNQNNQGQYNKGTIKTKRRTKTKVGKHEKTVIYNNNWEIIHCIPDMNEMEREQTKKMVGNALYDVFIKILEELKHNNQL